MCSLVGKATRETGLATELSPTARNVASAHADKRTLSLPRAQRESAPSPRLSGRQLEEPGRPWELLPPRGRAGLAAPPAAGLALKGELLRAIPHPADASATIMTGNIYTAHRGRVVWTIWPRDAARTAEHTARPRASAPAGAGSGVRAACLSLSQPRGPRPPPACAHCRPRAAAGWEPSPCVAASAPPGLVSDDQGPL